ncbi:hypothetical protein CR157_12430 [Halomonas sp. LBP4]|nr:hypothetical protein CR157_12430 [Halomonas sp. LBP4]
MIGYQYFRSDGFVWRKHQSTLIPLSMPHRNANVNLIRALLLLVSHRAFLIRWESNFDGANPTEWWHVIKTGKEELDDLSASTRSKVRRGMRQFDAAPLDRAQLLDEGHTVYLAAFERYETYEQRVSKEGFIKAIQELPPETEFWGVRDKASGKLVAFSENLVMDQACFYLSIWLDPDSLKRYSTYALIHTMNSHYLNAREMRYVSDGARSISHDTAIHDFLISQFGFRKAYARLHVVYFPLLSPTVHVLYPFRRHFERARGRLYRKIAVLLEQERIRRSFFRPPVQTSMLQ